MRRPAAKVKPRQAIDKNFPAPTGGWIRNENLATPNGRRPDGTRVNGAFMLENWFATATGIRMRKGSAQHAVVGDGSLSVLSLFAYVNGNNRSLFAATSNAIYEASTAFPDSIIVDDTGLPLVTDLDAEFSITFAVTPASVTGLTGGDWSVIQFATSGGVFLRLVNGLDTPLVYDGSSFGTTPAITVATPETLSHVWSYKNRLFFVQKDTLNAWYLPVDVVGGAAVILPLGGVFALGGSLLYGSSWSLDAGDAGGLSEQCVFISTEGEVAVFKGSDPADADTWGKVGVYKIGRPRGPHAFIRAGGDLVIATDIGFIPLSQAIQRDSAALSPAAVSYPIETAWNEAVAARSTDYWHCEVWPTNQMVLTALSTPEGEAAQIFVANARTGAWSLFTGWNALCLKTFGDRLFFGSTNGNVIEAEVGGSDLDDAPYTCTAVPLFDSLKNPAALKTSLQCRATIRSTRAMNVQIAMQHDYVASLSVAPDDTSVATGTLWGSATWGTSLWGATVDKQRFAEWQSTPGAGYALAPAVQITSGSTAPPDAELVSIDMTYDMGDAGS